MNGSRSPVGLKQALMDSALEFPLPPLNSTKFNITLMKPNQLKPREATRIIKASATRANGEIGQRASTESLQRLDLSDDMTASNCVFLPCIFSFTKQRVEKCHVVESTESIIKWPLWLCSEDLNFLKFARRFVGGFLLFCYIYLIALPVNCKALARRLYAVTQSFEILSWFSA